MKHIGSVDQVANAPYTTVTGTMSAGLIYEKVGKEFKAEAMFITPSAVICKVLQSEENNGGGEQECINEESPA